MNTPSSFAAFPAMPGRSDRAEPSRLVRAGIRLLAAFEVASSARARGQMLADAARWEASQPKLAAELRAASAHVVRSY